MSADAFAFACSVSIAASKSNGIEETAKSASPGSTARASTLMMTSPSPVNFTLSKGVNASKQRREQEYGHTHPR
jgi:hypothetical protein